MADCWPICASSRTRISSLSTAYDIAEGQSRGQSLTVTRVGADFLVHVGLSVDQIRLLLYSAFGSRQVSTIYAPDDTYQVILEADPKYADTNEVLRRIQVRTPTGALVPLDTVAKRVDKPTSLTVNHIAQLPSVIISFNLVQGVALGEAVKAIVQLKTEGAATVGEDDRELSLQIR